MNNGANKLMAFALILSIILITFSSCSGYSEKEIQKIKDNAWESGYESGYEDGYEEGHIEGLTEYDFDPRCVDEAVIEAKECATINGIDPFEAWIIIDCYQNNESYYDNGSKPTWSDYNTAIEVMIRFFAYFENNLYR